MMNFLWLGLILIFSFLLIKATDILVANLKSLAKRTGLGQYAICTFLLALSTSLPELFVGISAGLQNKPNLSLGNVIGANIANVSLVIGGAALLGGTVIVRGNFMHQDIFWAFLAGATPMILLLDKHLSRLDGLILLGFYVFYNLLVFRERKQELVKIHQTSKHREIKKNLAFIFLGVILLIFSANLLVFFGAKLALVLKIPLLLIGLFILSLGTTLPELAFSLKAIKLHQPQMVFGDLLGSIVANSTLIIGLVSLISPIKIDGFSQYLLATMAYVWIFWLFYFFIRTKHKLERWEGAVLIGLYIIFLLVEIGYLH